VSKLSLSKRRILQANRAYCNQNDWYNLTVKAVSLSNGTADINNDNQRQINSIDTDLGKQTLTVTWDALKDLGITELDQVYLQVTAHDGIIDGNTAQSDSFSFDSRAPETGNLQITNTTEESISLSWFAPRNESNFSAYKVCFGTTKAKAESCDSVWNKDNDGTLTNKDTNKTKVIGLTHSTGYYFTLYASDSFGNESHLTSNKQTTLKPIILCTNDCIEPIDPPVDDNNDQDEDNQDEDNNNNQGGTEKDEPFVPAEIILPDLDGLKLISQAIIESLFPKSSQQIMQGLNPILSVSTLELYNKALRSVYVFFRDNAGVNAISYTFAFIIGIITLGSLYLFSSLFDSLSSLSDFLRYLFNLFLAPFSFDKKRKPWGRVINTDNGTPIAGAIVLIIDAQTGKVREQSRTGKEGYFSSFLQKGKYFFEVRKQGWQITAEKPNYQLAKTETLYDGTVVTQKENSVLALIIALRPLERLPGEVKRFFLGLIYRIELMMDKISWPTLITFFAINTFIYFDTKSFSALFVGFLYIIIAIFKITMRIRKKQTFGMVYDQSTKETIDLAIIRLYDTQTNRLVATRVTDKEGKFFLLMNHGKYNFTVIREGYQSYQGRELIVRGGTNALVVKVELRRG